MKWKTLEHNGVLFPPEYNYQRISVKIKGKKITLNRKQEEMAWAWTKKKDTPYVTDKVFIKNFINDFLEQFEEEYKNLSIEDFDFTEKYEQAVHEMLTKEISGIKATNLKEEDSNFLLNKES